MAFPIRIVVLSGGLAAIVAGALVAPVLLPEAFAAEPQKHLLDTASAMFHKPFDPSTLRKFDISLDDSVSTKVQQTQTVSKIGFGKRTIVSIVTTPSGTYSSDAIGSPYVRYPGVEVAATTPSSARFGSATSPYGTRSWSYVTRGSFTFVTSSFTPTRR